MLLPRRVRRELNNRRSSPNIWFLVSISLSGVQARHPLASLAGRVLKRNWQRCTLKRCNLLQHRIQLLTLAMSVPRSGEGIEREE
jgi:hypothetical protein